MLVPATFRITDDSGLTVRQLFNPADYEYDEANMSFEIIVQKAIIKNSHPVSRVFWMED